MANIITNQQVDNEIIQMSNASTSIFFETLCISGADLAKDDYEKDP